MKVNATCPCGATFSMDDSSSSYIQLGGRPDEKGRIFAVQVHFDRWHDAHKDHKASPIKEFFGAKP